MEVTGSFIQVGHGGPNPGVSGISVWTQITSSIDYPYPLVNLMNTVKDLD